MVTKLKPGAVFGAPAGLGCHASWSRPDTSRNSHFVAAPQSSAAAIAAGLNGRRVGSGWMARCPAHHDRTPSLSIRHGHSAPLVKCFAGCDPLDVIAALRSLRLWGEFDADTAATSPKVTPSPRAKVSPDDALWRRIWQEGKPAAGTLADIYADFRGLALLTVIAPDYLRFHPRTAWRNAGGDLQWAPAMLALMRDPVSGVTTGLHRTFLTPDGRKNEAARKRYLGTKGAIALSPMDEIGTGLYVAEGIETALAVAQLYGGPVWAMPDAGTMADFPLLGGIECLTVFADHDASGVGQRAAAILAKRYAAAGRDATATMPCIEGWDVADFLPKAGDAAQ